MGYIYIMTNPCLKNMVKIGYATDVEERRRQLNTTALPTDYEIYATYKTPGKLEDKKLHKLIDNLNPDLRVSKNREFFVMTPQDAYDLLETIALISGTNERLKINKNINEKENKTKKPQINFVKCNIPIGAELTFVEDEKIKVIVESEKKVINEDEITSLSAVAAKLKNVKSIQGSAYFLYNGKLITEIAEETQWKNN